MRKPREYTQLPDYRSSDYKQKNGRQLLVVRRSLMGDVVINGGRSGRVGEANSWKVKQSSTGSGRLQDNGVVLD
jgi:hypothetical protein